MDSFAAEGIAGGMWDVRLNGLTTCVTQQHHYEKHDGISSTILRHSLHTKVPKCPDTGHDASTNRSTVVIARVTNNRLSTAKVS